MTTLTGLPGNDDLVPLQQYTLVQALGGNDTITYDIEQRLWDGTTIDGGADTDRLILTVSSNNPQPFADMRSITLVGIEEIELRNLSSRTTGDITITLSASDVSGVTTFIGPTNRPASVAFRIEQLSSFDLSNRAIQGNLKFFIIGDSDAEIITGSSASDTILTNGGDDSVSAGAGNDEVVVASNGAAVAMVLDGGTETDLLDLSFTQLIETIDLRDDTIINFETLQFSTTSIFDGSAPNQHTAKFLAPQILQFSTIDIGPPRTNSDDGGTGDGGVSSITASFPNTSTTRDQYIIEIDMGLATTLDLSQIQIRNNLGVNSDVTVKINGDEASENITGSSVRDHITGAGGDDTINGGGDNDLIEGGLGKDSMDGGTGTGDWLSYAGSAQAVSVNLAANTVTGGDATGDTIANFENIQGSANGDTLTGNGGVNTILGLGGDDTVQGGASADSLDGGTGTGDWLSYANSAQGVTVNLLTGAASGGDAAGDTFTNVENMLGSRKVDSLTGDGNANVIDSGAGNDSVDAGAGNDTIISISGTNSVDGGANVDTLDFSTTAGVRILDTSSVAVDETSSGLFSTNYANIERFIGSAARDTLIAALSRSLTFEMGNGNDFADLAGGTHTVLAGSGDDTVSVQVALAEVGSVLDGGADTDTLAISPSSRFGVAGAGVQDFRDDTVTNFEVLTFGGSRFENRGAYFLASQIGQFNTFNAPDGFQFARVATRTVEVDMGVLTNLDLSSKVINGFGIAGDGFKINGDDAAETIKGTTVNDTILAAGGNDTVEGTIGADSLNGGAGIDTLSYANSSLRIRVTTDVREVRVGTTSDRNTYEGFERIVGTNLGDSFFISQFTTSAPRIEGGRGADSFIADTGLDLFGNEDNDTFFLKNVRSFSGSTFDGGADNDLLVATPDSFIGDFDFRVFTVSSFETLEIDTAALTSGVRMFSSQAAQFNTIRTDDPGQRTVTIDMNQMVLDLSTKTITGFGQQGSGFIVNGGTTAERFTTTSFNDTILAGGGNDSIAGTLGADSINGGTDTDTVDYSASGAGVFVYLSGTDLSGNPIANRGGDAAGDSLTSVENLIGSNFRDDLFGDAGSNNLYGGGGRDFVFGLGGTDSLYGGDNLDFISGVDGGVADYMDGGEGRDVAYYFTANESQVVDMTDRSDLTKNSGEHTADTWVNISGFWGARNHSNTITGDNNTNDLLGGDQADVIYGGAGRDQLLGRAGDDQIYGGDERDLIIAGSGTDSLTGGAGIDTFYVLTGDGTNIVTDYVEGEDLFFFYRTGVSNVDQLQFTDTGADVQITSTQDTSFTVIVQNAELTDLDQLDANGQAIITFGFA